MFKEINASNHSIKCRSVMLGGAINDAHYNVFYLDPDGKRHTCTIYSHWCNMLRRAYSESYKSKNRTYENVSICKDWHFFSNFYEWAKDKNYKNRDLDKDLIEIGNKMYSHSTCLFVPQHINKLLSEKPRGRHDLPTGVTIKKRDGKFISRCGNGKKRVYLGVYFDKDEAHKAYKSYKKTVIIERAMKYKSEPDLYRALIRISETY